MMPIKKCATNKRDKLKIFEYCGIKRKGPFNFNFVNARFSVTSGKTCKCREKTLQTIKKAWLGPITGINCEQALCFPKRARLDLGARDRRCYRLLLLTSRSRLQLVLTLITSLTLNKNRLLSVSFKLAVADTRAALAVKAFGKFTLEL